MKIHLSRKEKLQMLTLCFPQNFHNHRMIQPEIRNLLSPLIKSICIFLFLSWLNNGKAQRWRWVLWLKHWTRTLEEGIQFLVLSQDFLCDLVLNLFGPLFPKWEDGYYYTLPHSLHVFYWIMSSSGTGLSIKAFRDTREGIAEGCSAVPSSLHTHSGSSRAVTSHCHRHVGQAQVHGTLKGFKGTCRVLSDCCAHFFSTR